MSRLIPPSFMQEHKQKNLLPDELRGSVGVAAGQRGGRLRVAFVTETYPPELNGVSLTVRRAVEYLRDHGHVVEVVRPKQAADRNIPADTGELLLPGMGLPLYPGVQFGFPAATRLRLRWRKAKPDVVHVATEGPLGWSALHAARALGIPVTTDYRTHFQRYSGHYGVGWLARPIDSYLRHFHNKAHVTFVSTRALEHELAGRGYENIVHVGRGIDMQLFNPKRRSRALRAEWGLGENDIAVIHVGRLAAEKNLQLAARSFDRVKALHPTARMIWVGDGPQRRRFERAHPDHVFMGVKSGEALAACYASANLFVFPSLTETFGNVTLEALASGLALVAFREGAAAQHARDGVNARLAAPGDEAGFLDAVSAVASSPALMQRLRMAAPAAVSTLAWPVVLSSFERHLIAAAHHYRLYANALAAS